MCNVDCSDILFCTGELVSLAPRQRQDIVVKTGEWGVRSGHLRKLCRTQTLPLAVRQYCDTMVEIGEWDKALMVAPSVSVAYWKVRSCQAAFV